MTHPGTPRDVDLDGWLDGIGFKPANTEAKQLGHEAARQIIGHLGTMLHKLLPAGWDKALTFTALEDVLMRANRSLALGDGPRLSLDDLRFVIGELGQHSLVPEDERIAEYKADQLARGEQHTGGLTGVAVQEADEPEIPGERPTEAPETFRRSFGNVRQELTVTGGQGYVAIATTGEDYPPQDDYDGRYGWYVNLDSPQVVNEFLAAVAAAGDRAFS